MTKSHLIKLPSKLRLEFVTNLLVGDVVIQEVGTFYITKYKKESHPSRLEGGTSAYSLKGRKVARINFRPHKALKTSVR